MPSEYEENMAFEAEVRSVAEAIWGLPPGECQPAHYTSNPVLHELDGIARLRDVTHVLMVTVSRKLEKTKDDVKKLNAAEKIEGKDGTPISKWFVTKHQLEAEHVKHARLHNVKVLTLTQFRNRFFDGREYVQKRRVAAFGSARNLENGTIQFGENEYVPLPIIEIHDETLTSPPTGSKTTTWGIQQIHKALSEGEILLLVAPFGAGKSLTVREVFLDLASSFWD